MLITDQPIDLNEFTAVRPPEDCGGSAYFFGRVRNHHEGKKVKRLFYECYKPMAEKEISKIVTTVTSETGVIEIRVVHRIGWLEVGDIAIAIAASGGHRAEAFDACRMVIDRIKESVPVWKKEVYEDATYDWVVCQHNGKRSRSQAGPDSDADRRGRFHACCGSH